MRPRSSPCTSWSGSASSTAPALDDAVADVAAAVQAVARRDRLGRRRRARRGGRGCCRGPARTARARDLARIRAGRAARRRTRPASADGVRAVAAIERRLAADGVLLPAGIPTAWLGQDFEAHGLPIGPASTVSFAVRWHGEHAAVLWEVDGDPVELTAPAVDASWRDGRRHRRGAVAPRR